MSKLPAAVVYLSFASLSSLSNYLVFTISAIYRVNVAGLDPLQLVLVGTVMEATVFLCEIPTGLIADLYSRRGSIIMGTLLIGGSYLLEGTQPFFPVILLAQVLWGIGYTFISGAQQAWIADEVGEVIAQRMYLRGSQVSQVGGFFATFASVGLASYRLGLPLVVAGAVYLGLGIFLLLWMPEAHFTPNHRNHANPGKAATQTFRAGARVIRYQPVVLLILAIGALHGLASEGLDRLWEVHFLQNVPLPDLGKLPAIAWFGLINAGANVLNIVAVELAGRATLRYRLVLPKVLLVLDGLLVVSLLAFSQAQGFGIALASCWATDVLRAANDPFSIIWLNQRLSSPTRATVFSISSQINAVGKILGGPVIGIIGEISVRAAIAASGMILIPALLLYLQALRHQERN